LIVDGLNKRRDTCDLKGLREVEDADFEEVEEDFGVFGKGEFIEIVHARRNWRVKLWKGK
jgi:hypothetical protein